MTQNNRKVTKNLEGFSSNGDRVTKIRQLTLSDYFDSSSSNYKTTTEQVCIIANTSESDLRKCRIGSFMEIDNWVILHKGRNCWRLLKV